MTNPKHYTNPLRKGWTNKVILKDADFFHSIQNRKQSRETIILDLFIFSNNINPYNII